MVAHRSRLSRLATLVLLVLLSAVATGIMATQASDPNSAQSDPAGGTPVARIGDETITTTDLRQEAQIVQANVAYMQGEIANKNPSAAYLQDFVDIITTHGKENVAFAVLIQDRALYQLAVQRGFEPSDAQVKARVEQQQKLYAQGKVTETDKAIITSAGEDYFWSTLYPMIARRQLATQALWQSVTGNVTNASEQALAWLQIEQQAIEAAPVTVIDPTAIAPASKSAAMIYLKAYWTLQVQ